MEFRVRGISISENAVGEPGNFPSTVYILKLEVTKMENTEVETKNGESLTVS